MPCYNNQRNIPKVHTPSATYPIPAPSLAVASVVVQPPGSPTYDACTAFMKGTIYKELDKPFLGKGGCCG